MDRVFAEFITPLLTAFLFLSTFLFDNPFQMLHATNIHLINLLPCYIEQLDWQLIKCSGKESLSDCDK